MTVAVIMNRASAIIDDLQERPDDSDFSTAKREICRLVEDAIAHPPNANDYWYISDGTKTEKVLISSGTARGGLAKQELVAAEREACAKIAESIYDDVFTAEDGGSAYRNGCESAAAAIAAAIRARGGAATEAKG